MGERLKALYGEQKGETRGLSHNLVVVVVKFGGWKGKGKGKRKGENYGRKRRKEASEGKQVKVVWEWEIIERNLHWKY